MPSKLKVEFARQYETHEYEVILPTFYPPSFTVKKIFHNGNPDVRYEVWHGTKQLSIGHPSYTKIIQAVQGHKR